MLSFPPKLHGQADSRVEAIRRLDETPPTEAELEERKLFWERIQRVHQEFANRSFKDSRKFPTTEEMQREDRER